MDDEIEPVPDFADLGEQRIERGQVGDVAVGDDGGLQRLGQGDDALLERFALIGERQLGAGFGKALGDAPCDGALVGDTHDKAALALHQAFERHAGAPIGLPAPNARKSKQNQETG